MKAKRRIKKFNFDQEKMLSGALTHVALVDTSANLIEAITMKAKTRIDRTSKSSEEYDDDGSYSSSDDSITITDTGEAMVRVSTSSNTYSSFYVRIRD